MSHVEIPFFVTNNSNEACMLAGVPRLKLLDAKGQRLKLRNRAKPRLTGVRSPAVELHAGEKAEFTVEFGNSEPYDEGRCPAPSAKATVVLSRNVALTVDLAVNACTDLVVSAFSTPPPAGKP